MGRGRDFREPRRRGFDDDAFNFREPAGGGGGGGNSGGARRPPSNFSQPMQAAEGPVAEAVVKWFNPQKGFGFAEMSDGSGDAFLHIAVLQAAGRESVAPGATLKVQAGQGAKGRQITRVIEVDESTATEQPRRSSPSGMGGGMGGGGGQRFERNAPDPSTAVEVGGTVKWFNGEKGFGFVATESGGKDVFVHISVLERGGLSGLAEGQHVTMRVVDTPKGREAISISPAD